MCLCLHYFHLNQAVSQGHIAASTIDTSSA